MTIYRGARQHFRGFGVSCNGPNDFEKLPLETKQQIAKALWKDLDFRVLRIWSGRSRDGARRAEYYRNYVNEALKQQPNLIFLFAPGGWSSDIQQSASFYAEQIEGMKNSGIDIEVTGISNEPYNNTDMRAWIDDKIDECVVALREQLDKRNLSDVRIVAPENCNIDSIALIMSANIINNDKALEALDGFAFHSYNMCMVKNMYDLIEPHGKEIWITGSADNGPENENDGRRASMQACRFLSDINKGVNYWIHFLGAEKADTNDNATRIIWYEYSGEWGKFLKYFYYKQLSEAFVAGTVMRNAKSDLGWLADDRTLWYKNFSYHIHPAKCERMEHSYGNKAPIVLASGFRPDRRWAVGVCNCSGAKGNIHGYYLKAQTFKVSIVHEELMNEKRVKFDIYRSNERKRNEYEGTLDMENGVAQVTVKPFDLVTLVSTEKFPVGADNKKYDKARSPQNYVSGGVYDILGRRIGVEPHRVFKRKINSQNSGLWRAIGVVLIPGFTQDGIVCEKHVRRIW